VLGAGTAVGEAYVEWQRYIKQFGNRGVILAVCSKNAPELAEA
jgi:predicted enzyme involved in methoxymalonyl-ACP biosynthesis